MSNGYVDVKDAWGYLSNSFTIMMWLKLPYLPASNVQLVDFGPSSSNPVWHTSVTLNSAGYFYLRVYRGTSTPVGEVFSSSTIAIDTWTHIAVTWDGTYAVAYKNGVLEASSNSGAGGFPGSIYRDRNYFGYPGMTGYIDEIRFYDR